MNNLCKKATDWREIADENESKAAQYGSILYYRIIIIMIQKKIYYFLFRNKKITIGSHVGTLYLLIL